MKIRWWLDCHRQALLPLWLHPVESDREGYRRFHLFSFIRYISLLVHENSAAGVMCINKSQSGKQHLSYLSETNIHNQPGSPSFSFCSGEERVQIDMGPVSVTPSMRSFLQLGYLLVDQWYRWSRKSWKLPALSKSETVELYRQFTKPLDWETDTLHTILRLSLICSSTDKCECLWVCLKKCLPHSHVIVMKDKIRSRWLAAGEINMEYHWDIVQTLWIRSSLRGLNNFQWNGQKLFSTYSVLRLDDWYELLQSKHTDRHPCVQIVRKKVLL